MCSGMDAAVPVRQPAGRRRRDQNTSDPSRGVAIDVNGRTISLGGIDRRLRRLRPEGAILPRYIDMVLAARGLDPTSTLTVRSADLLSLSAALETPLGAVGGQLRRAMIRAASTDQAPGTLARLVLPAAGLVTAGGAGTAIYLGAGSGTPQRTADTVDPSVQSQRAAGSIDVVGLDEIGIADAATTTSTAVGSSTTTAHAGTSSPSTVPATSVVTTTSVVASASVVVSASATTTAPVVTTAVVIDTVEATAQVSGDQAALPNHLAVGAEALDLITFDWRPVLPEWRVVFLPGRQGLLGYAFFDEQRIEIYVRSEHTPEAVAATVAHELGHAVDVTLLSSEDRDLWLDARDIEGEWWPEETGSDYASGAGDWAEAFAVWQLGQVSRSKVAGQPTPEEISLLVQLAVG